MSLQQFTFDSCFLIFNNKKYKSISRHLIVPNSQGLVYLSWTVLCVFKGKCSHDNHVGEWLFTHLYLISNTCIHTCGQQIGYILPSNQVEFSVGYVNLEKMKSITCQISRALVTIYWLRRLPYLGNLTLVFFYVESLALRPEIQ